MTDPELITAAYVQWLSIGVEDADDQAVRDRIRLHGDQTCLRFMQAYPWPFKQATGVVITAKAVDDGYVPTPDDFATFGSQGILSVVGKSVRLKWIPSDRIFTMREADTSKSQLPRYYSLVDTIMNPGNTLRVKSVVLYPRPAVDIDLQFDGYEFFMRPLVDAVPSAPPATCPLWDIPTMWHTVILDGTIARLMEDEGDERAPTYEARFLKGLAMAWNEERPGRGSARRPPRYGRHTGGRL